MTPITRTFALLASFAAISSRCINHRSRGLMLLQNLSSNFLAQVDLRFAVISQMSLKLDDIKVQMIERGAHSIKPVLRLDNQFVVSVRVGPFFLLLGERAVAALAAPLFARAADPAVENS